MGGPRRLEVSHTRPYPWGYSTEGPTLRSRSGEKDPGRLRCSDLESPCARGPPRRVGTDPVWGTLETRWGSDPDSYGIPTRVVGWGRRRWFPQPHGSLELTSGLEEDEVGGRTRGLPTSLREPSHSRREVSTRTGSRRTSVVRYPPRGVRPGSGPSLVHPR